MRSYSPEDLRNNRIVHEGRQRTEGRRHYWISGPPIFSLEQITALKSIVEADYVPAEIEGDSNASHRSDKRRTQIHWLDPKMHTWVYEIIQQEASKANALFQFDVVPMYDPIQLAIYDADEEGFFTWHADTIPADLTRKISITCPLNDDSDYEGGVLELNSGAIQRPPQRAGAPIMFPSWVVHRVTPVTKGKRYSLVAWVRGPNWR